MGIPLPFFSCCGFYSVCVCEQNFQVLVCPEYMYNGLVIFLRAYFANARIWVWLKRMYFESVLASRFVNCRFDC